MQLYREKYDYAQTTVSTTTFNIFQLTITKVICAHESCQLEIFAQCCATEACYTHNDAET